MPNSSYPEGTNTTTHNAASAFSPNHPITDIKIGMTSAYAIIITMGLFGNAIGLRVTCKKTHSRSVANILISNMAAADLLVTILVLPFSLKHLYIRNLWFGGIVGQVACTSLNFVTVVPIAASIFTVLAVSIDKFYAVFYPLRRRLFKRAKLMSAFIWIASVILMSPYVLFWRNMRWSDRYHCIKVWLWENDMVNFTKTNEVAKVYYTISFVCLYAAPLSIIAVLHVMIGRRLWLREVPGNSGRNRENRSRENRKSFKLLSAIVMAFALLWIPTYVMAYFVYFDPEKYLRFSITVNHVFYLTSRANIAVNPCLYIFFNGKFRRDFIASIKIRSFFKRHARSDHNGQVRMANNSVSPGMSQIVFVSRHKSYKFNNPPWSARAFTLWSASNGPSLRKVTHCTTAV